jgi:hypothetical protein
MASRTTAEEASLALDRRLRQYPWYLSTGVGDIGHGPVLFLYVKAIRRRELEFLDDGWMGYKVLVKPIGSIRPAMINSAGEPVIV